jgi:hypothetical protein
MRQTLAQVELRQNDNGEYWLDFSSDEGQTSIGLSRGSRYSTDRAILEAWQKTN